MATFWTADLHLGHARISELAGRPFSNVASMNAHLIKAWNSRVTEQDTVWVLGDVCMGALEESLNLIPLLHGHKILVPGNHDRCWDGHPAKRKPQEWEIRYRAAGFDHIYQPPVLSGLDVDGFPVLASHFPYRGDSGEHDTDRYADQRPEDFGNWLLHGHTHGKWRQRGRMIDVGVDAWGGRPVSEYTIAEMITAGPADIPSRTWHTPA